LLQNTHLDLCIDYIFVSVARNLDSYIVAIVFHIFAFENLAKCAHIDKFFNYISVGDLLSWSGGILAVMTIYLIF